MSPSGAAPDQMTFWEHLQELRVRLVRSLLIVVAAFAVTYSFPFGLQDHIAALKGMPPLRFLLWRWVQQPVPGRHGPADGPGRGHPAALGLHGPLGALLQPDAPEPLGGGLPERSLPLLPALGLHPPRALRAGAEAGHPLRARDQPDVPAGPGLRLLPGLQVPGRHPVPGGPGGGPAGEPPHRQLPGPVPLHPAADGHRLRTPRAGLLPGEVPPCDGPVAAQVLAPRHDPDRARERLPDPPGTWS